MISERAKRADIKELEIFDHFEVDRNLPKYSSEGKPETKENLNYITIQSDVSTNSVYGVGTALTTPQVWVNVPRSDEEANAVAVPMEGRNGEKYMKQKKTLKKWLVNKLQSGKKEGSRKLISIVDFFTQVTKSYEELTPIAEIATHYENAIIQANIMGQVALVQKLKDSLDVVKGEAILIVMGLKKYVTEKQIIEYYEKVGQDKNLKLTWIKNFGRIIPERIYQIKKEIDERRIFDNYILLHYDPKDDGAKLTKEEIEKKKDPILFGVIKNSKKLYFIADWKDDFCDLTLEEMFKVLKGKVLEINNKSVKTYISKIQA